MWKAGIEVELREVKLRDKPAEMLALSPKGTVPVLRCSDGTVLDESLDIGDMGSFLRKRGTMARIALGQEPATEL